MHGATIKIRTYINYCGLLFEVYEQGEELPNIQLNDKHLINS